MSQGQWNEEDYRQEIIFGGLIGDACGTRNEFQSGHKQDLSIYDSDENAVKEAFHEGEYTKNNCHSTGIDNHNKGYLTASDDSTFMLAMADMMKSDEYKRIEQLRPKSNNILEVDSLQTMAVNGEIQASYHTQMRRLVYKYMAKWYKKNKYPLGQYGGTTLGILSSNANAIANLDEKTIKSPTSLKIGQHHPYDEDKKRQHLEYYLNNGYTSGIGCSVTNGAIMKAGAIASFSNSLDEARAVARASAMSSHNEPENAFYTDMYVSACWFAKEYKMQHQGQNIDPQEVKRYVFDNLKTIFLDNFDKNFNSFAENNKPQHIENLKNATKHFLSQFFISLQDAMDVNKTSFKACFPQYDTNGNLISFGTMTHNKPNQPQNSVNMYGGLSNGVGYARTPHTFAQAMYSVFSASNFLEAGRNAMADGTDVDTEGIVAQSLSAGIFGLPKKIKQEMQNRFAKPEHQANIFASTDVNGLKQNSIGGNEILSLAKGNNVDAEQQKQEQKIAQEQQQKEEEKKKKQEEEEKAKAEEEAKKKQEEERLQQEQRQKEEEEEQKRKEDKKIKQEQQDSGNKKTNEDEDKNKAEHKGDSKVTKPQLSKITNTTTPLNNDEPKNKTKNNITTKLNNFPDDKREKRDDGKKNKTNIGFNNIPNIGQNKNLDNQELKKGQLKKITNNPAIQQLMSKEKPKSNTNNQDRNDIKNNNQENSDKKADKKPLVKQAVIDKINPLKVKLLPQEKIDKENDKKKEEERKKKEEERRKKEEKKQKLPTNDKDKKQKDDKEQKQNSKLNDVPFEEKYANLYILENKLKQKFEQAQQEYEEHKKTGRPKMTWLQIISIVFPPLFLYFLYNVNKKQKAYDEKNKSLEKDVQDATNDFKNQRGKNEQLKQEYEQNKKKEPEARRVDKRTPKINLTSVYMGRTKNFVEI